MPPYFDDELPLYELPSWDMPGRTGKVKRKCLKKEPREKLWRNP